MECKRCGLNCGDKCEIIYKSKDYSIWQLELNPDEQEKEMKENAVLIPSELLMGENEDLVPALLIPGETHVKKELIEYGKFIRDSK